MNVNCPVSNKYCYRACKDMKMKEIVVIQMCFQNGMIEECADYQMMLEMVYSPLTLLKAIR